MKTTAKLGIAILVLAILTPLALFSSAYFKAGPGWGEGELTKGPKLWKALFPNYTFRGWENKGLLYSGLSYAVSAVIGIAFCLAAALLLTRLLTRKKR
ncbi:MAG: cobalamin biosynthesis protein [Candidatus Omnitrophica bacterium]|nr:cobalamin biosynthesis protein [Candidatus Omnitrophota bacterium]